MFQRNSAKEDKRTKRVSRRACCKKEKKKAIVTVGDGKRNDRVVSVKVNVDQLTCGYCSADKECKEQENDCEQVAKSNEVLVHAGLRMVQVVCFLRQCNIFKMR